MNKIIESLFERKSARIFLKKEIDPKDKALIIDSALQAPTAGNMCLYSIIDISDQSVKDKLAVYCDNQPFIAQAPMVLVFAADYQKYYELYKTIVDIEELDKPQVGDLLLACSDAAIAAQNTVVAAESLGIGSCYIGDVMENHDQIKELLNLPDYTFPFCMLVYGYPTDQQKQRSKPLRFKAEDIVYENKYEIKDEDALNRMFSNQKSDQNYKEIAEKIYNLKYNVAFRKEMNKSVAKYLEKWR